MAFYTAADLFTLLLESNAHTLHVKQQTQAQAKRILAEMGEQLETQLQKTGVV